MSSIVLSVFFALSYVLLAAGLILWKKSDAAHNFLLAFPLIILVTLLYGGFAAGIINIVGIPVNILSISIANAAAGVTMLVIIRFKKVNQGYYLCYEDLFAIVIITLFVALIASRQFGMNLIPNYETIDPSRHLTLAQDVIKTGSIDRMYFTNVINAIFIEFFSPIVGGFKMYKVFVLSDICMLLLSALVFFSAIRQILRKQWGCLLSLILTLCYFIGYPLNNTVFGFVYLGVSVSIGIYMLTVAGLFGEDRIDRLPATVGLMLGAYGIFVCYTLFVPAVYIAVALSIARKFIKNKELFSLKFFICELEVFLVPVILGMYYIYFQFVDGRNVVEMISNEGYNYRSLYAPLLFVLPLTVYGFICSVRKKNVSPHFLLFSAMMVFTVILFVLGMKGQVSSYYYYKVYYMLSPACFLLAAECASELLERSKTALVSYGIVWAFLAVMNFGYFDQKIAEKQFLMSPINISGQIFDLYNFNFSCIGSERESVIELTLYEQAYKYITDEKPVGLLSTTEPTQWFEAYTDQCLREFYAYSFDTDDPAEFMEKILDRCEYAVVPAVCDERLLPYTENWETVFSNEAGKLCRIR